LVKRHYPTVDCNNAMAMAIADENNMDSLHNAARVESCCKGTYMYKIRNRENIKL